jgi:hypothetical protein
MFGTHMGPGEPLKCPAPRLGALPPPSSSYRSGAKYGTIVQYLLLVFAIFEVLEGPTHGSNELETSNCN